MKSVKLEKEAEVHAEQLAKAIIKRMMEWFPLVREYKEGKVHEDFIKKKIIEDVVNLKEEMQARFVLMKESYENSLKDYSETQLQQIKTQSKKELEIMADNYETLINEQNRSIETIIKRYIDLETAYILPTLDKISANKHEEIEAESIFDSIHEIKVEGE